MDSWVERRFVKLIEADDVGVGSDDGDGEDPDENIGIWIRLHNTINTI